MPTNSVNLATYKAVKASKAVGSATQPVYIASDGTITTCTAYGSASVASATSTRYLQCPDTRSTNPEPSTFAASNGVSFDFKSSSAIGLTAADYSGVMSFRPYASGTDWSGGNAHQLAFNNSGLYWRQGGSSWGSWIQLVTNSGTYGISITGNAATASAVSWANVTNKAIDLITTTSLDADAVRTTNGIWIVSAAITNAPTANHGALFGIASVGTPCQYFMPDNSLYIYKRWYSSSAWNTWQKISAGYADSAGSANAVAWGNVSGKPGNYPGGCTGNAASASTTPTVSASAVDNANVNGMYTTGLFQIHSLASGQSLPVSVWAALLVLNFLTNGANTRVQQICWHDNEGDNKAHYTRTCYNGVWTAWKRIWIQGNAVTSAVWNDYAEARESLCTEPGRTVQETGSDTLALITERLAPCAGIVSDTWGFSQGKTDRAKTHIAVAGRVLAYPYRNRDEYKPGDVLCAAPGGTVDIMTREEVIQYPDRIVGTVSCVPNYDEWGGGEGADRPPVKINGRIWVRVH